MIKKMLKSARVSIEWAFQLSLFSFFRLTRKILTGWYIEIGVFFVVFDLKFLGYFAYVYLILDTRN